MIRTLVSRSYAGKLQYVELTGNSTDEKPKTGIITGSKFTCVDTGIVYLFDEDTGAWYPADDEEQASAED